MKLASILPIAIAAAIAFPAIAQQAAPASPPAAATGSGGAAASNMEILREKLKADKKLIVAQNMVLTDAESKAFWPLYDEYQAALLKINRRIFSGVSQFADDYQRGPMSKESAKKLVTELLSIEGAEAKMRRTIAPKLEKAVGAPLTMRYLQIENKIRAIFKYELASAIPLAE
jgi:hypothetical protein